MRVNKKCIERRCENEKSAELEEPELLIKTGRELEKLNKLKLLNNDSIYKKARKICRSTFKKILGNYRSERKCIGWYMIEQTKKIK